MYIMHPPNLRVCFFLDFTVDCDSTKLGASFLSSTGQEMAPRLGCWAGEDRCMS